MAAAIATVISIVGSLAASSDAAAQGRDLVEERRQLEASRYQREEARKEALERDKALQADLAKLQQERESLNARLVDMAKAVQASEAQMTEFENQLADLEVKEAGIRRSLETSHGSISSLLAAMQRMGRNPPPVMVTRREDALTMVRSAMLLASAFPEMRGKAMALATELNELARVIDDSRRKREEVRAETARLEDNRLQLSALIETRKQTVAERQKELADIRKQATELARDVANFDDLIGKLDKLEKTIAEKTRLGAYEKQLAAEALAKQKAAAATQTGPDGAPKAAARPAEETRPSITLQPGERLAMASPGRIQPAIPFEEAKGRLILPVQGKLIQSFGDRTQAGRSDGIVYETRPGAQVVSPNDGWVMFAGDYLSYGQILIINGGGGYHVLLAGLSQANVQMGDFVLAGEPVGLMASAPKIASVKTQETAPLLYVEFRKSRRPFDPMPWWAETARKVAER